MCRPLCFIVPFICYYSTFNINTIHSSATKSNRCYTCTPLVSNKTSRWAYKSKESIWKLYISKNLLWLTYIEWVRRDIGFSYVLYLLFVGKWSQWIKWNEENWMVEWVAERKVNYWHNRRRKTRLHGMRRIEQKLNIIWPSTMNEGESSNAKICCSYNKYPSTKTKKSSSSWKHICYSLFCPQMQHKQTDTFYFIRAHENSIHTTNGKL